MPSFIPDPTDVANLVAIYRSSVPPDIASAERDLDEAYTMATIIASALASVRAWARNIAIGSALGSGLDAQGTNVGLSRQGSELDEPYRARLQLPPAAGTWQSIVDAVQSVVTAAGGPAGSVYLVELPRDGACFKDGFYCRNNLKTTIYPLSQDSGVVSVSMNVPACNRGKRMSGGLSGW